MKLSKESKGFLSKLSSELEAIGAKPVVLRNYDDLPDEIGNDLDIFVTEEKNAEAEAALVCCVRDCGGDVLHVHKRDYFTAFWLKIVDQDCPLHLDLYPGALSWHGYPYLNQSRFVESKRKVGEWFVPRKAHEAVITLLTSLLWGGFFKDRYAEHLQCLLAEQEEREEFIECLKVTFGTEAKECVERALEKEMGFENALKIASKLRRALRKNAYRNENFGALRANFSHWLSELECYFIKPPGVAIEVPPDPSGNNWQGTLDNLVTFFFGGRLDERKSKQPIYLRMLRRLRARGKNHLVILNGNDWKINGEILFQPGNEPQIHDRVGEFLSQRIPANTWQSS